MSNQNSSVALNGTRIKVIGRVRPLLSKEKLIKEEIVAHILPSTDGLFTQINFLK